jgi:chromosome segregation ATPase
VGEDRPQTSRQRVTVAQAAEILGVTVEAIRGRIKRGTLEHERHSGTVYVLLDADQPTNRTRPDTDQTADRLQSDSAALISAKDETITTLRDQLEAERQAHAEARRIIAGLVERIPAIEAPSEPPPEARESDVSPGPTDELGEVREELGAEQARREMAETTLHEGMAEEQHRREEAERERDYLRRELFGLREPRESPETVEEEHDRSEPHSATGEAQESVQRPWWRRVFGG